MTNADYIKSKLSDRDLCKLFLERSMFYQDGFLSEVRKVFEYWRSFELTDNGNVQKDNKIPSIWKWEKTHNHNKDIWENTGRTKEVSFLVWLFVPHDKEYWNNAIKKYNKYWNK